jgi:hypothetical protein
MNHLTRFLSIAFPLALFSSPVWGSPQETKLLFEIPGPFEIGHAGMFTDGAGDVNGDGVPDILMGSWGASPDVGGTPLQEAGATGVYSGVDGSLIWEWTGDAEYDHMGRACCAVDDVNGDGYADVAVGAWGHSSRQIPDPNSPGNFLPAKNGRVWVYSGFDGQELYHIDGPYDFDYTVPAPPETPFKGGTMFGRFMRDTGDIDGDGIGDFIVGAYGADVPDPQSGPDLVDAGAAFVFSGVDGSIIYQLEGPNSGDIFGRSVSGAGDIDGDGVLDFTIGSVFADYSGTDSGSVYVFSGATGLQLLRIDGDPAQSNTKAGLGRGVSDAGDVNGDGIPDIVAGEYLADNPITQVENTGAVIVYSGADGSEIHRWYGETKGETLGWFVDGVGDMDGDGLGEVLGCGYQADSFGLEGSGRAYLWAGSDGSELTSFFGTQLEESFGRSGGSLGGFMHDGDIDGDGISELVIGASFRHQTDAAGNFLQAAGAAFVFASNQGPDNDSDGLSNYLELAVGSRTGDVDSDDDGLADGEEGLPWTSHVMIADTDRDGMLDGTERGVTTPTLGTNLFSFIPDADPLTTTHAFLADSDLGGKRDGVEDSNQNGAYEVTLGELDPNDPSDDVLPLLLVVSNFVPGQTALFEVYNAAPGSTVWFLYSVKGNGPTYMNGKDVWVDLTKPVGIIGSKIADANGYAWITEDVPSSFSMTIWLQAGEVDLTDTARVSNWIELP